MKVIKILILGYSSFVRRRVAPTLKKNKNVNFCICSLSSEIDQRRKILFNNYKEGLKKFQPDLVYISKVNSLHYRLAKKILNLGFNVIVDKPITLKLKQTRELIKIAKTKKLLLAESVVFNYHKVFETIKKQYKSIDNIEHVQSVFNIPFKKKPLNLKEIGGDCESDMSPYAASIIRIFLKSKINNLNVNKSYFKNSRLVKNFCLMSCSKKTSYFGNFAFGREYSQKIIFYTKNKVIYSPDRIFALPSSKKSKVIIKTKNEVKKIKINKDDCIDNFFKLVFNGLKKKKYKIFYNMILKDAKVRNLISSISK